MDQGGDSILQPIDSNSRVFNATSYTFLRNNMLGNDIRLEDGDEKFVTPGCSFKNVLIGSIKPTTLNVTPGDEVILEKIILDEDQIADPSVLKGFHEAFKDKYVCIFLLPMSPGHKNSLALNTTILRDVHEQIKSSGGKFHVICVPTHIEHNEDDSEFFNPHHEHSRIISRTLFHHIYINNSACLKRMERMIGSPKEAAYVIIGPMKGSCRKVVAILDSDFIKWHGAEAFPFTTKKIQQLAREDEALWSGKHDLGTLLSIPDRDYVISNDLTKVPISDLHQRTVCVLFYEDTSECRNWTEKLKKLYVARKDFEVVVVFSITFGLGLSREFVNRKRTLKFWKVFHDMPWLAIPLDDPKCRQLWRIFNKVCSDTPKLLIIYSGGKYFKENGFKVLEETGFKNYPFMREEVVRTSVATVRKKNLSSFLGRNELIRGRDLDHAGREKFTASKLLGGSGCSFKNALIGSIKSTTLNVTPGDEVILEKIILDEDQIADPSVLKGFHEAFKDKYVCIFLLPMSPGHKNSLALNTTILRDVHEQIKSSGGKFHVICVPTHIEHNEDDSEFFNPHHEHSRIISRTLFHHIYINNSACLKRMERMIGSPKEAAYVIIGPMKGSCRKVVAILDSDFIKWHGAEAFPFTTKKIQQLAREDEALWSGKHDLGTLLSIPDRDYVISNDLTKVPISDLHQRTVCILFYEDTSECRNWTEKLKKLYVARKDFEVVVVFSITFGLGLSMEFVNRKRTLKFWEVFHDMPWLAIPIDDPKCRQLWRIFNKVCSDTPKLLIIYSGGKYFKENGFKVLEETGFKNYPFMREEVVRTSVAAVREKNLSSFLGRNELIRGRDLDHARREKFTASKLLGGSGCSFKNVLIGSIKPTTLNVTPGDEVILEKIILDEDQIADPSVLKGFHEAFKDNYVCIFLLPLSPGHKNSLALNTTRLRNIHEQIKSSGGKFHVICVPTHIEHNEDDFEYFNPHHEHSRITSRTLFHHIYINNSACLKRMERMIGSPKEAAYVIIGPMKGSCRKVVAILDSDFIKWHGAEAFPFTTEKMQQLAREDEALWSGKHDLGTLLSIPDRDYVISNDLTKVPISDLHQRTVCILFYEDTSECRNWTEKLKKLYVARKDFEVVVVFSITFGQGLSMEFENRRRTLKFWEVFHDMPWLAIPLDDPKCRQLWRIFNKVCSDTPKLLIIYSGGKYFKENGFKVLEETGFKNYPFMRLEVVRTSVAAVAVREKNLSSFLGRNELIRGRDYDHARREKFTASKLLGGSVVLLFLGVSGFRGFSDLLTGLEFNHVCSFWSVEKFEIVYIPLMESPPGIDCGWMLASRCKEQLIPCFSHFFEDEINQNPGEQFTMAMVSFGQFGHYNNRGIIYSNCSKAAFELFLDIFPFKDNEEKEGFKFLYTAAINKPKEEDYV